LWDREIGFGTVLERIPVMFEHSLHAARSFCILEG
jgi:hypothetical protein